MMRLLFVIPEYPPLAGGGISTFYRLLLPELVKRGHSVRAIVGNAFTSRLPAYEAAGVAVEFLDHEGVEANVTRFERFRALPELQHHLAAAWTAYEQANAGEGYDVVETVDWGLLFVPWVAADAAPATVVQLHGSVGQIEYCDPKQGNELFGSFTRLLEVHALQAAEELQTYSKMNAREWEAVTNRHVTCIPPAWAPIEHASSQAAPSVVAVAVGRVQYWKGPIVLCEALRLLGSAAPLIHWIGRDTPYRHASISMSAHLHQTFPDVWGVKVRPVGALSSTETAIEQARALFCVVPSLWDVFNFACAEGMGAGRTVACSTGAGASDLIVNGENGFVFPANDAEALATALDRILSMTSANRAAIGHVARETVLTSLSAARVAAQRSDRYEALGAQGGTRRTSHPWLMDVAKPCKPLDRALAFLDSLPLRDLSEYTIRRSLKRVFQ